MAERRQESSKCGRQASEQLLSSETAHPAWSEVRAVSCSLSFSGYSSQFMICLFCLLYNAAAAMRGYALTEGPASAASDTAYRPSRISPASSADVSTNPPSMRLLPVLERAHLLLLRFACDRTDRVKRVQTARILHMRGSDVRLSIDGTVEEVGKTHNSIQPPPFAPYQTKELGCPGHIDHILHVLRQTGL